VRQVCDENNILLVLDEVQVGVGRTGKYWGYENLGIEPDIFTSAKGLAGGIPIGAMMCKDSCAVFNPGEHASTFGGNPFSCAAGLAVVNAIESENLLENVNARGRQLRTALETLAAKYDYFVEARGWGLINGLEIKADLDLTSIQVVKAAMDNGLLIAPAGPKVLRFVPPLIVSEAEVDEAIAILDKTLAGLNL
jgi:acetylornithine aminotransferase